MLAVGLLVGRRRLRRARADRTRTTLAPDTTLAAGRTRSPCAAARRWRTAPVSCWSSAFPGVTEATDPLVDELVTAGVGGVMLRDENIVDEEQAIELVAGLRARLGEHLLVAIDDEGGRVTAMGALDQPVRSARTLGQARRRGDRGVRHRDGRAGQLDRRRLGVRAGGRPRRR